MTVSGQGLEFSDERPYPAELNILRSKELQIRWRDGHESVYPLAQLRLACPCATCRAEREERLRNPLRVVAPLANQGDMATVAAAELVGNYALRITWRDGHATGIYDYGLLRSLCRCAACAAR